MTLALKCDHCGRIADLELPVRLKYPCGLALVIGCEGFDRPEKSLDLCKECLSFWLSAAAKDIFNFELEHDLPPNKTIRQKKSGGETEEKKS